MGDWFIFCVIGVLLIEGVLVIIWVFVKLMVNFSKKLIRNLCFILLLIFNKIN